MNEGTETFTILNGTTVIGTQVTVNVSAGAASAVYGLPAGMAAGTYTIEAVYNGTADYLGSTDTSQSLTVNAAVTATAAASAFSTFSTSDQDLTLTATITSTAGVVNEGTETFTILNGTTVIGTAVTVNVSAGAASAVYLLPGGTGVGTYTIQVVYSGTNNFLTATDTNHTLVVGVPVNVTGLWQGTLYQPDWPYPSYPYVLDLVQTQASVTGSSLIEITNQPQYYGEASLTGSVSGNVFTYTENSFLAQNPLPGYYWINIIANLQESPDGNSLTGTWSGGTISLTRVSASSATILPTNLTVDTTQGGVDVSYQVTNGPVPYTIPIAFYWSANSQFAGVLGGPVTTQSVLAGTTAGSYGPFNIPLSALGAPPQGANYLLAVSDPGDLLGNFDPVANVVALAFNATTTEAASATATFSVSTQTVALSATVTSATGTVNEGTETFTILNGTTVIGSPVTVNVSDGNASANYTLPGGTGAGTYSVNATYNLRAGFLTSSDNTHTLTVNPAGTALAAANVTAYIRTSNQEVTLTATVTSGAGTVAEGTVTFSVFNGVTQIGTSVTSGTVSGGKARVSFTLPGGTEAGTYTIQATYNPGADYQTSSDNTHSLTVSSAPALTSTTVNGANVTIAGQSVSLAAPTVHGGQHRLPIQRAGDPGPRRLHHRSARGRVGERRGRGDCWDLADAELDFARRRPDLGGDLQRGRRGRGLNCRWRLRHHRGEHDSARQRPDHGWQCYQHLLPSVWGHQRGRPGQRPAGPPGHAERPGHFDRPSGLPGLPGLQRGRGHRRAARFPEFPVAVGNHLHGFVSDDLTSRSEAASLTREAASSL